MLPPEQAERPMSNALLNKATVRAAGPNWQALE
jgi:hypothetical protein